MELRAGVRGTFFSNVFFTEEAILSVSSMKHLSVEISRQNANLSEVKELLAQQAIAIGASGVMNFRYGQRKHEWWELIFTFKWDTESWFGEGDAVRI